MKWSASHGRANHPLVVVVEHNVAGLNFADQLTPQKRSAGLVGLRAAEIGAEVLAIGHLAP